MKTASLLCFVCALPLLALAQDNAQQTTYQPQPAPVLGHPLNPADVATLTGHSGNASSTAYGPAYVTPVMSYDFGKRSWFGRRQSFGFQGFFFPHSRGPGFFFGGPSGPGFVFPGSSAGHR